MSDGPCAETRPPLRENLAQVSLMVILGQQDSSDRNESMDAFGASRLEGITTLLIIKNSYLLETSPSAAPYTLHWSQSRDMRGYT